VTNDVDTLATALYATTDDMLKEHPELAPWRPPVGITPRLSDAELVTLATMQAILGFTSEAKWLRHARARLRHLFPYLPQQPGYNKRLRKAAGLMRSVNRILPATTSVWSDDVWVVDSTPVECGRSRETVKRSDLAGWAEYGYCASHSRFFWGLRLHLVCTLQGLPITFALTGAKADERETLLDLLAAECELLRERPRPPRRGRRPHRGREPGVRRGLRGGTATGPAGGHEVAGADGSQPSAGGGRGRRDGVRAADADGHGLPRRAGCAPDARGGPGAMGIGARNAGRPGRVGSQDVRTCGVFRGPGPVSAPRHPYSTCTTRRWWLWMERPPGRERKVAEWEE
jgi:hypothetical protein